MENTNWECPHCGRSQVVNSDNYNEIEHHFYLPHTREGDRYIRVAFVTCASPSCKRLTFVVNIHKSLYSHQKGRVVLQQLHSWRLIPEPAGIPQPDYIPKQIRENYYQACRILELSPLASATLSRRCLQGMIRDFCGIRKDNLSAAIKEPPPDGVMADTVDAIDAVRAMGNIGAHMEGDVDLIVEVDPNEAQTLTNLIELLLSEWYVQRHERAARIAAVVAVNDGKQKDRKPPSDVAAATVVEEDS